MVGPISLCAACAAPEFAASLLQSRTQGSYFTAIASFRSRSEREVTQLAGLNRDRGSSARCRAGCEDIWSQKPSHLQASLGNILHFGVTATVEPDRPGKVSPSLKNSGGFADVRLFMSHRRNDSASTSKKQTRRPPSPLIDGGNQPCCRAVKERNTENSTNPSRHKQVQSPERKCKL